MRVAFVWQEREVDDGEITSGLVGGRGGYDRGFAIGKKVNGRKGGTCASLFVLERAR